MRRFAAVTTCHEQGYSDYGREMLQSFDKFWPEDVTLYFYAEAFTPDYESRRIVCRDLLAECPELVAFKERHKDDPVANGARSRVRYRFHVDWRKPKVKVRRVEWGLGYWWDAVRFSHKTFSIFNAAERCEADVLFWIDADIRVFARIPSEFLDQLVPETSLLAFLKRPKFSECGFVAYNLRHPAICDFFAEFEALYTTDSFFKEEQFHDSWLFDVIRQRFEKRGCATHDIAEGLGDKAGHVFINSKLGRYMDHMKGTRKEGGASKKSDLVVDRDEGYWTALSKAEASGASGAPGDEDVPASSGP